MNRRYVGWSCVLNCFMLSSLPCFYAFCWSAIPTSCYIFNVFYSCIMNEHTEAMFNNIIVLHSFPSTRVRGRQVLCEHRSKMLSDNLPVQLVHVEWGQGLRAGHHPNCLNEFEPQGDVLLYGVSDQHDDKWRIHWWNAPCTTVVQYRQWPYSVTKKVIDVRQNS